MKIIITTEQEKKLEKMYAKLIKMYDKNPTDKNWDMIKKMERLLLQTENPFKEIEEYIKEN